MCVPVGVVGGYCILVPPSLLGRGSALPEPLAEIWSPGVEQRLQREEQGGSPSAGRQSPRLLESSQPQ